MSLYKFTHITLLKNNAQLKPKKWKKKSPKFIKKNISCPGKKKSHLNQKQKKKKKKRRRRGNVQEEGKKKVKKSNVRMKPMCSCTWAFLSIKQPHFLSLVFSLFLGENFWWIQRKNTWISPFIFLPSHPTKHTSKKFSFPFSLQSFSSTLLHLQTNTT